ncbi:CPBP family intramembrane metalloprotease [Staphylococcus saprophyticus]|nr:CPBP family intramembrane metalloprotease [Staphylococcus saprophyticus]
MIKHKLASEMKTITKIIGLSALSIILIILLVYSELAPKKYLEDINLLRVSFAVAPIVAIILYVALLKLYKNSKSIANKYLKSRNVSWNYKIVVLFLTYIMAESIKPYVRNGKPDNQKSLDQADNDFIKTLIGSGFQAPIIEEIVFRGLLFLVIMTATSYLFNKKKNNHDVLGIAVFSILSTVVFGLVHVIAYGDYEHIMTYIVSGAAFTFAFVVTRDIKVPIILHMLNNIPITLNKYHYEFISGTMFVIFTVLFIIAAYRFVKKGELNRLAEYMEQQWQYRFKRKRI